MTIYHYQRAHIRQIALTARHIVSCIFCHLRHVCMYRGRRDSRMHWYHLEPYTYLSPSKSHRHYTPSNVTLKHTVYLAIIFSPSLAPYQRLPRTSDLIFNVGVLPNIILHYITLLAEVHATPQTIHRKYRKVCEGCSVEMIC